MKSWVVEAHPTHGFITSLADIEKYGLESGKATEQPWSGSYWPDRFGGIAARYRQVNQKVSIIKKPSKNYRRFERLHSEFVKNYDQLTREQIQLASAAEKYDLLMGDRNFSFTKSVWNEVKYLDTKNPGVVLWSGICDGWTSSSLVMHRPRATVSAVSPDGKIIDFYPDDLKALVSYQWAHKVLDENANLADGTPKFVSYGYRCYERKPKRGKNGAVLNVTSSLHADPTACRDINPGVWHLNLVNRLGAQGHGFVIDIDYNKAVNNHAVAAYDFKYFNLNTGKVGDYKQTIIPIEDYKKDPFRTVRNSSARYLIGVSMNVKYMNYGMPIQGYDYDNESVDKTDTMSVIYDMELDANQRIVSGQWRVNKAQRRRDIRGFPKPSYPDFMWYQRDLVHAPGEDLAVDSLMNYDWTKPLPASLRETGQTLSKYVTPIWTLYERVDYGKVVDKAFKRAAKASSEKDDAAWFAYCETATGYKYCSLLPDSDPASKLPQVIEARRALDAADAELETYHKKLDEMNVPRNRPYPQLMGRVVYGLFEAAKTENPSTPKGKRMESEQSGYEEN